MSQWSYVVPIEKSEFSEDAWVISGVVAGPNFVDSAGDEFLPQAISDIADFINSNRLPLLDWHGKNHVNTIMDAELGEVTKAWVDSEKGELWIEAELDKDVPASQWLKKKIDQKKKQFGLSIHGVAQNVRPVLDGGKLRKQIADLLPDEISLTTRPFYQPSLGTVISKAIDEAVVAESVQSGDKSFMTDEVTPQAGDESVVVEEVKVTTVSTDAEVPPADVVQEEPVAEAVVSVEKSEDERVADMVTSLTDSIRSIVRQEIGTFKVEPVVPESAPSVPADTVVEKSERDQPDRLTIIEKAILELGDKVERVLDSVPESTSPGVLIAKSHEDELRATFENMSASERIRAGFAMREQELR